MQDKNTVLDAVEQCTVHSQHYSAAILLQIVSRAIAVLVSKQMKAQAKLTIARGRITTCTEMISVMTMFNTVTSTAWLSRNQLGQSDTQHSHTLPLRAVQYSHSS